MSNLHSLLLTSSGSCSVCVIRGSNVSEKGHSGYYRSHPTYLTTFKTNTDSSGNYGSIIHKSQHRFDFFVRLDEIVKKMISNSSSFIMISNCPSRTSASKFGLSKKAIQARALHLDIWMKELLSKIKQWDGHFIYEFNKLFEFQMFDENKDNLLLTANQQEKGKEKEKKIEINWSQFNKDDFLIPYESLKFDEKIDSSGKGHIFRGTFQKPPSVNCNKSSKNDGMNDINDGRSKFKTNNGISSRCQQRPKRVAIKSIFIKGTTFACSDPELELLILSKLKHENILTFIGACYHFRYVFNYKLSLFLRTIVYS